LPASNPQTGTQLLDELYSELQSTVVHFPLFVGFSGGMDSTVLATAASGLFGPANVRLVHLTYGPYTYFQTLQNVLRIAKQLGSPLELVDHQEEMEGVLRHGPACNLCTRKVKLGGIRALLPGKEHLVATGSNQSDSWGHYGMKILNGTYSPLLPFDKHQIEKMLFTLGWSMQDVRAGESERREGCKAKHLLKMLTVPPFHGHAVSLANEVLLDVLRQAGFHASLANVKIIGPLRENIALVNVFPHVPRWLASEIGERIATIGSIERVFWVDRPAKLVVKANPSLFRVPRSRNWILQGKLLPEFAAPLEIEWQESNNNRLHTFQAVDCILET